MTLSTILPWKKETTSSTAQKWESLWTHIQNTAARNVLLLGRIKMATENVYIQIYRQRGIQPKIYFRNDNTGRFRRITSSSAQINLFKVVLKSLKLSFKLFNTTLNKLI
eukprot:sb/3477379/